MDISDGLWKYEIEMALADFSKVAKLADHEFSGPVWEIEFLPAPHKAPGLPVSKMAIYAFWGDGGWLKIGKAGPNSDARYRSQHYVRDRARSSLAGSLLSDEGLLSRYSINPESCGGWIKSNTHRCNILLSVTPPRTLLALLEAFLHHRLKPRYES